MKTLLSAASLLLGARKQKTLPVSWIAIWALTVLTAYAAQEGDFTYWDSGASITIAGYTGSGGAVAIPDAILGKPVTSIEGYAFEGCTGLTSVTIPNSVTSIGHAAFSLCTSLASVTIPDSVTSLGGMAFYGCTSLADVTIPDSVTSIENGAFAGCQSLTSVMIGSGVTAIATPFVHFGPMPFSAPGAFSDCSTLLAITVGALNSTYSSVDGVLFDKNQTRLIQCPQGKTGSYTIPNSVTSIGYYAFQGCTGLRTLYFLGNAPGDNSELEFEFGDRATIFYRAGTTGWGSIFGGRPAVLWIPTDNLDHDGMNNLEEMLAGTDPLDASSLLAFEAAPRSEALVEADQIPIPAGKHALYFKSIPGMRYEILSSDLLGGAWASTGTVDATALQKRVMVDKSASAAFYRIQVVP